MKKQQLDHVLRAAGRITGDKQFLIIGSQSLHGKHPDVPDDIARSVEAGLISKKNVDRTEWLNAIGQDSPFHETSAITPTRWTRRRRRFPGVGRDGWSILPPGDTEGVKGLCLDPHDLAIAKYVARREKDRIFTRELAVRGITERDRLLGLVDKTPVEEQVRERIRDDIARDFAK